jgi:hypothetical protein
MFCELSRQQLLHLTGIADKIVIDDEEGQGDFRLVKDKTAPCGSVREIGIV